MSSLPEYTFHFSAKDLQDILGDDLDMTFAHGFGDDPDEIDKILEEELGIPARKRPRRKKFTK